MRVSFRAKLLLLVGTALLALIGTLVGTALRGLQQTRELSNVERRMVPLLELGPRLEAEFDRLTRSIQDAVSAQDQEALAATARVKVRIIELVNSARGGLTEPDAAAIRWAIQDYYDAAQAVARRMIAGEAGEALIEDAAQMQILQAHARSSIKKATVLDRGQLTRAFSSVRDAAARSDRLQLVIGLVSVGVLALLSFWVGRSTFQVLSQLSQGFKRFGTGDFSVEIPVTTADELGDAAKEANQMASSLRMLAEQRDREEWLQSARLGLSERFQGELASEVLAERGLTFLARHLGALAAALYLRDDDGVLRLKAHYAAPGEVRESGESLAEWPIRSFREGQGLVGATFAEGEPLVVHEPPAGYLAIQSGLGHANPRSLLFWPLAHHGHRHGVLELALLKPWEPAIRDLLDSIQESFLIALDAAKSRGALGALLVETQALAERLAAQEEELRTNNQDLVMQQEELRRANEELEEQRQRLHKQNHDLEQAGLKLQEKASELERVSAYKSQFLANMSHELRTPLNSMLLLSHLLAENGDGNLTKKQVDHLRTVHAAGDDLLSLINQILDLAKIEAGKQDLNLEPVLLEQLILYARRNFEPIAAHRGLSFAAELGENLPTVLVTDRQQLERILTNLLGNAVKFTEKGGIRLSIERFYPNPRVRAQQRIAPRAIAFRVEDTGVGIPKEAQERIFAPFEQAGNPVVPSQGGTGLGLSISRETTRHLGGDLFLESQPGKGSAFICVLPERALPMQVTTQTPSLVSDDRDRIAPNEGHLLVIEDDPVMAEEMAAIVHARHLKVTLAQTGQEGLALARRFRPLGIILDVRLPDMDGWTVLELLKQDPATRSVPVHFVSSVDAPERGLALGAVGYLVKPATRAELSGVIRTLVPKSNGSLRILVVEDDAREGESILALLENEGLDAEHVLSAEAALEAIEREEFACMILDLGLPSMDGLELLQALRKRGDLIAPRVVVHTGRSLTKQETRRLQTYSEAVVLKSGNSAQRLIEEVRLFVGHLKQKFQGGLPEPLVAGALGSLAGVTLLVAEDDMRTVYALSALLQGKGAKVLVAETGREALTLLDQNPGVQGVLMDLMMPEMDGYQAMQALRQDSRFAEMPVIALTAKAMQGERERCLAAGATDYLTKPIDPEKLLATLQSWIQRRSSDGSN